ncbi:MAG: metalloregulator ArsR/SmtB family transcription factor [Anaerosomatales bacterium]|nr:metalloregulator ArsR/SmtB family transcription factor [Anaerosomatales bacterium]
MVLTERLTDAELDAALKALASAQRREIVRLLASAGAEADKTCCAAGEVCACRLSERLGLAASTISHHMAVLRDAGLVHARKDGTWVYYSLDRRRLREVADAIADPCGLL